MRCSLVWSYLLLVIEAENSSRGNQPDEHNDALKSAVEAKDYKVLRVVEG